MIVPGTDGQKMSKSYNNIIDIFLPDKKLRKQVMSIVTDSIPMEEPKDPTSCHVFSLYKLLANSDQIDALSQKYKAGNFGYGHAKQELFELIIEKFSDEREKFNYLMQNKSEIDKELRVGAEKAKIIAKQVLNRVRSKTGY